MCALRVDNALTEREGLGPTGRRRTCRGCRNWADHVHDRLTGEIMRVSPWPLMSTAADVDTATILGRPGIRAASVAPPEHWHELAEDEYLITVEVATTAYDVVLPADGDSDGTELNDAPTSKRSGPVLSGA